MPTHAGERMTDATTTIEMLKKKMADFIAERNWQKFHDPKNLSASIAIEAAELMEHFQWLRSEDLSAIAHNTVAMAEIREELADITCYVLSFANALNIDLSQAVEAKMEKNAKKYPADQYRGRARLD